MPRVMVWKCKYTGALFEDEKKYKNHLQKLRRERAVQQKLTADRNELDAWFTELRKSVTSFDELKDRIIQDQSFFWKMASRKNAYDWSRVGKARRKGVLMPIPELIQFNEFELSWKDRVSNTHKCPQSGGVTNWRCEEGLPKGYPGWIGRISWIVKWPKEWSGFYPASDLLDGSGIFTGTGGGGGNYRSDENSQHFGYSVEMFAQDWPGLYEVEIRKQTIEKTNRQKATAWKQLGGNPKNVPLITELPPDWTVPEPQPVFY